MLLTQLVTAQNVGIGTTTPLSQLHIGNSGANELIISRNKYVVGFTHCIWMQVLCIV